jgi:hypothetical protein
MQSAPHLDPLPAPSGYVFTVAQIFNLLNRRFVICKASERSHAPWFLDDWQSATLRYSRLQVCATGVGNTVNRYPSGERKARTRRLGLLFGDPDTMTPKGSPLPLECVFSGVRPSSAAATSACSSGSDCPNAAGPPRVSAPEEGRTPLNTYPLGKKEGQGFGPELSRTGEGPSRLHGYC